MSHFIQRSSRGKSAGRKSADDRRAFVGGRSGGYGVPAGVSGNLAGSKWAGNFAIVGAMIRGMVSPTGRRQNQLWPRVGPKKKDCSYLPVDPKPSCADATSRGIGPSRSSAVL